SADSAMMILARGLDDKDLADLLFLTASLKPQMPPELRVAAVSALTRTGRSDVPERLLAGWEAYSPSLRNQILDALIAREDWSLALLSAVEKGRIAASQFDARR